MDSLRLTVKFLCLLHHQQQPFLSLPSPPPQLHMLQPAVASSSKGTDGEWKVSTESMTLKINIFPCLPLPFFRFATNETRGRLNTPVVVRGSTSGPSSSFPVNWRVCRSWEHFLRFGCLEKFPPTSTASYLPDCCRSPFLTIHGPSVPGDCAPHMPLMSCLSRTRKISATQRGKYLLQPSGKEFLEPSRPRRLLLPQSPVTWPRVQEGKDVFN